MSEDLTGADRAVPGGVRRGVVTAAYILTVITAAANFDHARSLALFAGQHDGGAVLAAAVPDVLLAVAITVLAFRPRQGWAWAALAASIGFVFWAAVVTSLAGFCDPDAPGCTGAEPSNVTRILVAVWPLVAAVLLAGIVATFAHRPTPTVDLPGDEVAREVAAQEQALRAQFPTLRTRTPDPTEPVYSPPAEPGVLTAPVLPDPEGEIGPERTPFAVGEYAEPVRTPGPTPPAPGPVGEYTPAPVAALRRTTHRPTTAAEVHPASPKTRSTSTDVQIIDYIRQQPTRPSIRTLKSTFKISQTRATTLLKTATQQPITETKPSTEENPENHHSDTIEESTSKPEHKSHLGTTGEVGRPDSVRGESPALFSAPTGGGDTE